MQPAPASSASLPEPGDWAATLGNRLRYLQSNLGEETPESRQGYLEDELRRALQAVPASRRGAYLEALAERFPTWELATVTVQTPSSVTQATPEETIKAFLQLVPQLSVERRAELSKELAGAGLVPVTGRPLEGEALADIVAKLKMGPDDPIDPVRLGKLFAGLADVAMTLDQLAWNLWKSAAPRSQVRRDTSQGDLRLQLRRALGGDPEVSAAQVQKTLESTRQLIAGLLAGLGPAGRNFARRFLQKHAPEAVREAVRAEGPSGLFANAEARCWKKYTDLSAELTEASIEADVQDAVVKYAEELIRGTAR